MVRHWISLEEGGAVGQDGWVREVKHCSAFLYADDGLVASTDLVWLKGAFDTLTRLFDMVELQENVGKTVGMIYSRKQLTSSG